MRRHSLPTFALALGGLLVVVPMAVGPAQAETPEEKGFAIAARSDRSDRGFTDSVSDVTMVLRNKAGDETSRRMRFTTLEVPDESVGDKTLVVFETPRDIQGTALLSHAKILEPDDQWLFLPALKRVKRISSANKSGPFVGSEFAFEDFTSQELEKYDYKWLRAEPCDANGGPADAAGMTCDVVERTPRYENSGYTKQVSWVDQEHAQIRRVDFHDRRGDLLKVLLMEDYQLHEDAYWRTHLMRMSNKQTGKETDLKYDNFDFKTGLDDDDFVKGVLRRIR